MNLKNVLIADFETTTANTEYYKTHNDVRVILWYVKSLNGDFDKIGTDIYSFWDYLNSFRKNLIVYFHNLSFDGDYIIKFLNKIGYPIINGELNNKGISINRLNGVIYSISVFVAKKIKGIVYKYNIEFKCSFRLLNASINKLGKAYGINKHLDEETSAFYDVEPQSSISGFSSRFIEYIKNDVEIARRSLLDFKNMITNLSFVKLYEEYTSKQFNPFNCLTSASLSLRLMKMFLFVNHKIHKRINEPKSYLYINTPDHQYISNYYHGGFSQFNTKYQHHKVKTKNLIMIDVNSAYPYQMTLPLPYGDLLNDKPEGSYCEWVEVDVKSAKIKNQYFNIPILLNWNKDKTYNIKRKQYQFERYVKSQNNFKCYYLKEEWDMINEFYVVDVNSIKHYYQRTKNFLKNYITELYDLKAQFKKEGNAGFQNAVKIILNAGYGVYGKRIKFDAFHYYDKNITIEEINNKDPNYRVHNQCINLGVNDLNCYRMEDLSELNEYYLNKALASYVTAKERVYLYKKIISVKDPNKKFALCDTDSVLFCNLTDQEFNAIKSSTNNLLGGWDIEFDGNLNISIFGSKKYCISDIDDKITKFRFAGINNKEFVANPMVANWDADSIIINSASLQVERCRSGILLKPKDKIIWKGLN